MKLNIYHLTIGKMISLVDVVSDHCLPALTEFGTRKTSDEICDSTTFHNTEFGV